MKITKNIIPGNHDIHYTLQCQGAKKTIFTACHSSKLKLAFTSPDVISTSPGHFLTSRIDFIVLLLFKFLKKHHLPIGQVKTTEFTSLIAKSTSPGPLDTTFFACCMFMIFFIMIKQKIIAITIIMINQTTSSQTSLH